MQKSQVLIPLTAGLSAMALVGSMGYAAAMQSHDVTLTVDGAEQALTVREDTVADVLELQGVELGSHDVVLPAEDTKVVDGMDITVLVARPLEVTVDGESREVWTTGKTVGEALGFLDLDAHDSKFSASRSAGIGREGLSVDIITAKDVTLIAGGKEQDIRLAGTVGDVLAKAGITPDSDDIVSEPVAELLADGMEITFTDVEVKEATKDVVLPFKKTSKESKELPKGEQKVTIKGVEGLKQETYEETYHDGKLVESKKVSEKVVKKPVTQVTTVGTYVEPKPEPAATSSSSSSDSGSSSTPRRSGGKYDWMAAAGIPERDWKYVDYIVSRESGWNPSAVNRSSGACGLVQALPCSKLGSNWRDPVHALRWQHNYVKSRYGGYAGAYSFWTRNHWY